jgi:hypothetical protein
MMRWNVVIGGQSFSLTFAGYMRYVLPVIPRSIESVREGVVGALFVMASPLVLFYFYAKIFPMFPSTESRLGK